MGILWRSVRLVCVMLAICLSGSLCVGCVGRFSPLPDSLGGAFRAELVWEREGVWLRGEVTVGERCQEGVRELTLRLLAPSELAGVCVVQTESGISMEMDGTVFEGLSADGLVLPLTLLLAEGELTQVCEVEEQGRRLRVAERTYGGERVTYYFSLPDGIPVRVVCGDLSAELLRFERNS